MINPSKDQILAVIRKAVESSGGQRITRKQFLDKSGLQLSALHRYFQNWTEALTAAGFDFEPYHQKIESDVLLEDWAQLVRKLGEIPTRNRYKIEGKFSTGVFDRNFGSWSSVPEAFRAFAVDKPEWSDVLALLPEPISVTRAKRTSTPSLSSVSAKWPQKFEDRPTYGDPIDFRGLRHAPVNEAGVIFLFGMVAKELGYLVEVVQAGFPDCEAKRQIAPGKWQRVRIEFEFESRAFEQHGHGSEGCDLIVCWNHNWPNCPESIEVLELSSIIAKLAKSDD